MNSMPPSAQNAGLLRFGVFELDLRAGEIYKRGLKIKLQEQPFQILAMLLERPGEVVTREDLRKRLWPPDTFVDFDHSLNTAIKKLRQALGDDADKPRFIETLPRRGYRFIGTVEEVAAPSRPVDASAQDFVGGVFALYGEGGSHFVLLPVDEDSFKEKQRLEAANDDLGLSLLVSSQKILLLPTGSKVRVLEAGRLSASCQVRILEGEHIGLIAWAPRNRLRKLS